MSEAIHHDETIHYPMPDQRITRRTATFGLGAICVLLAVASAGLGLKLYKDNVVLTDIKGQLDRADSDNAELKTNLSKTDATATDLRSQLTQAKQQQADLQAQIKKGQESVSGLQTELDRTRAEVQSQHDKDQAQLADQQAQLSHANEGATALRNELTAAKSQTEDLKAQLAKIRDDAAKLQPAAAKARALPLASEFQKAFWGDSFTLQLKNQSAAPLKLDIQITGSPKTPSKSVTIEGNGTFKLDDVATGARIAIASEGFDPVSLTAK